MWIEALADILIAADPDWPDQVRRLIAGRDEALLPAYRQGIDHNGEVILQLSRDVLIARTDKQYRKLRGKLTALRDDLAALAEKGSEERVEQGSEQGSEQGVKPGADQTRPLDSAQTLYSGRQ